MKLALSIAAIFVLLTPVTSAQNPDLRSEAVLMLEKANSLSIAPKPPNLERTDVFRVLDASSTAREGTFRRVVVQGVGRREETVFGNYHTVDVFTHDTLTTVRSSELAPAEVDTVMRLTPIYRVTFADDDVIQTIVERAAANGQKLHCIQFQTIRGKRFENNEICLDAANGTYASEKIGTELVEYGEFFSFAGAMFPKIITYSTEGVRKLEITQSMVEVTEPPESILAAPPNPSVRTLCKTYKRAIAESIPQPPEGHGGRDIDVAVRGIIGMDGRVHQAVVQDTERPDLSEEALALVRKWIFAPAVCNGQPNEEENVFIVHFHGR